MSKINGRCPVCGGDGAESTESWYSDRMGEPHNLDPHDSTLEIRYDEDDGMHEIVITIQGEAPKSESDDAAINYAHYPARFCPSCGQELTYAMLRYDIMDELEDGDISAEDAVARMRLLNMDRYSAFPIAGRRYEISRMVQDGEITALAAKRLLQ